MDIYSLEYWTLTYAYHTIVIDRYYSIRSVTRLTQLALDARSIDQDTVTLMVYVWYLFSIFLLIAFFDDTLFTLCNSGPVKVELQWYYHIPSKH